MPDTKTKKPPKGNSQKPANDFTGRKAEQLAKEHEAELAARENELSMANQPTGLIDFEDDGDVIDVTEKANGALPIDESIETTDDVVAEMQMIGETEHFIRVNEDVQCTIGYGNLYDFKAGKKYKVPTHVYVWLEERSLIWH